MSVVRKMSGIEMPSTPKKYVECGAGIHGSCSLNCSSNVPGLKCVYSGMDAASAITAVINATYRPALMARSPNNNTTTPPAIGSHVRNERSGNPCMCSRFLSVRQEPAQHHGEADHHPEGIGIEEAALDPAHDPGHEADGPGGT